MLTIHRFGPSWGLPCISPFVTKLVTYLTLRGDIPFRLVNQDLSRLNIDAPRGKLPFAIMSDGVLVPDSSEIIAALQHEAGDPLDRLLTPAARAETIAWVRLCDEHLYWSAVVFARWRIEANWQEYRKLVARGFPGGEAAADQFRLVILGEFEGHGMGRRTPDGVLAAFLADVDAIQARLGDEPFFFGAAPHGVDAVIYAILAHIIRPPFHWAGREAVLSRPTLVSYCERLERMTASFA